MSGAEVERIGQRQYAVLTRAWFSSQHMVMPGGFLENRACRRLVARGLMVRPYSADHANTRQLEFNGCTVYRLTAHGRNCEVAVQ